MVKLLLQQRNNITDVLCPCTNFDLFLNEEKKNQVNL